MVGRQQSLLLHLSRKVRNGVHPTLSLQSVKSRPDSSFGEEFDGCFQFRISLAKNLVKIGGRDSGPEELLKGAPCLDGLMLAGIADQKDSIPLTQPAKELV